MIAFDLRCDNDHVFEAWFKDGAAYEAQQEEGRLCCPVCGSCSVRKAPSAVAVRTGPPRDGPDPRHALAVLVHRVAKAIRETTEDVGHRFAEEALKMHYGASEPRNIRGVATAEEEEMLRREEVPFFKFPLPDEEKGSH
ncbi:DUF1178 family protein [Dissulfurirhabdus thermomarina]|uniref:DUF1178 family protein n=1 Tax=Dissulfurirhabdus thermomarina TaxID=1765737 RepID=A0A6N9TPZ3_DISTH|nr:DUF1178 family protein [Dissulfurirhabdus thermomarina]NDY42510.1 DUF1178 family protein [Dissulfurirhabdus thermomarina]NMX24197.1 DUF1178 family protein [Dissulfurirhabdus thermomarina]